MIIKSGVNSSKQKEDPVFGSFEISSSADFTPVICNDEREYRRATARREGGELRGSHEKGFWRNLSES